MFEHQAATKLRRRSAPAVAESMAPGVPSWDPMSAQSTEDGGPQRPGAGFDIGNISIFPPEPQVGPEGGNLLPDLTNRIQGKHGGGAPLEPTVQNKMEASFGYNFADVRIHADGESDVLNRSVGANAFTVGSDIFLGQEATRAGAYGGDQLLAHELTHVVQQRGGGDGESLTVTAVDDPEEHEASAIAGRISAGDAAGDVHAAPSGPANVAPLRVQRDGAAKGVAPSKEDAALARRVAVLEKQRAADRLDIDWSHTFAERIDSYEAAILRISGGKDKAIGNFQKTQSDQAMADQLAAQLFGGIAAFVFAVNFEWAFAPLIGNLGGKLVQYEGIIKELKMIDPSKVAGVLEKAENPANSLVSSGVNIMGVEIAKQDAEQGAAPDLAGNAARGESASLAGGSFAFLTSNLGAIKEFDKQIEQGFKDRGAELGRLTDQQWLQLDLGAQQDTYEEMLKGLTSAGSGVEELKSEAEIAEITEKYLWSFWLKDYMKPTGGYVDFDGDVEEEVFAPQGDDIIKRLVDLGIIAESGALLTADESRHGRGWQQLLAFWAWTYLGTIHKPVVYDAPVPTRRGDSMA